MINVYQAYLLGTDGRIEKFMVQGSRLSDLRTKDFEPNQTDSNFYIQPILSDNTHQLVLLADVCNKIASNEEVLPANRALDKLTGGRMEFLGNILLTMVNTQKKFKLINLKVNVQELFDRLKLTTFGLDSIAGNNLKRRNNVYFELPPMVIMPLREEEQKVSEEYDEFFQRIGLKSVSQQREIIRRKVEDFFSATRN